MPHKNQFKINEQVKNWLTFCDPNFDLCIFYHHLYIYAKYFPKKRLNITLALFSGGSCLVYLAVVLSRAVLGRYQRGLRQHSQRSWEYLIWTQGWRVFPTTKVPKRVIGIAFIITLVLFILPIVVVCVPKVTAGKYMLQKVLNYIWWYDIFLQSTN